MHIFNQASLFEWAILEQEAKLMGWSKTFERMTDLLEHLHKNLFGFPFKSSYVREIQSTTGISFPYRLKISVLAKAVVEKRAWKKIYGGRFILKDWISEWIQNVTRL